MNAIVPYLGFDGKCREAMTFYAACLGAEIVLMPFGDMPGDIPAGAKDRIMHARVWKGAAQLMASDGMPGMPMNVGNHCSVSVHCESKEEIERIFAAFAAKGKVTMPLADQFWGARFGMITDEFGIQWMFNYEFPK